jgi:hypothetical protein
MSTLARPGLVAAVLAAAALALHPALGAARWLPGQPAVLAALVLLAALALAARAAGTAERRPAAAVTAAGTFVLVGALGVDGLRGHRGVLTLAAGQSRGNFDEEGLEGRSLGLRPLGFAIRAERVAGDRVVLAFPVRSETVELAPGRSIAFGGYRFARPRATTTGGAARLRVAASDAVRTLVAEVVPGVPGRAGDLTIALERYFPDFALDGRQQPFSRSGEPRNPAALLTIEKGGQTYRAFVLQAMPGVHRVEELGLAFSLLEIEPERTTEIAVHRAPAAPAALVGALLLAAGLALSLRLPPEPGNEGDPDAPILVAGWALVLVLLLVDRGAVLAWSFGVPSAAGRVLLAGTGVLLGAALIAALGGRLLLAARRLAGGGVGTRPVGRAGLGLAVLLAGAGLLLAVVRAASLPGEVEGATLLALAGVAGGVAVLAGSLFATGPGAPPSVARLAALALPLAALVAVALAIALAVSGVLGEGTYATPAAAASAATALLGLSALEETGAPGPRRFAFLLALLVPAIR